MAALSNVGLVAFLYYIDTVIGNSPVSAQSRILGLLLGFRVRFRVRV